MKIFKETIVAGKTIMRGLRPSTRIHNKKGEKRKPKMNPSSEAVRNVNKRNAERKLTALLNNNFKDGDYHLTLTYKGDEPSQKQAKRDVTNFLRNVRNKMKRSDQMFKYIQVTEWQHQRIHHHIICSAVDIEMLSHYWKHGGINVKPLDTDGNYSKLAEYLIKETEKTFRLPESATKRRWTGSRNLVMPEVKREIVSSRELEKELKAVKGYQIDQDTIRRYEHKILGIDCLEFIMIALDDKPKYKRWSKGKSVGFERNYPEMEHQERMIVE